MAATIPTGAVMDEAFYNHDDNGNVLGSINVLAKECSRMMRVTSDGVSKE